MVSIQLRALRLCVGLSVRDLAQRTGYSVTYLHRIEAGKEPGAKCAQAWVEAIKQAWAKEGIWQNS